MSPSDLQTMLLSILTSIITGGFILVFVEIGNRKNRENDRYDQKMVPFMHKLSSYFRFLNWCSHRIEYPKQMTGYEKEFKSLVTEIGGYGGSAIISGGDYGVDYFSADKLNNICLGINNIWYYHDKMNPCRLIWEDRGFDDHFIAKELKDFFPNYLSHTRDVNLVSKVSGDFYTDIYQPIEYETYKHEAYVEHFRRQSIFVAIAVGFVLLVLNTMLFVQLPIWMMQMSGVATLILLIVCLLLLGVEMNTQIKYYHSIREKLVGKRKNHNVMSVPKVRPKKILRKAIAILLSMMIPVGLLLSAWAVLSIEIGILPKIPVSWGDSVVQGVNRILLNLSYSYIAGVIIYGLAVKLPALRENNL